MGRRIRWLGIVMVACFGLVVAQLVNIQLIKAKALRASPNNPRIAALRDINPRGEIRASDGTLLAQSVKTPATVNKASYPYDYVRQYPHGELYAGITGYDSALTGALTDIENEYNSYLGPHKRPAQTLSQLLFREQQPTTTDNVTLTVEPALQQAAWDALTSSGNNDGAVVVLDPKSGAVLVLVSNPTYDPNALVNPSLVVENYAYAVYTTKNPQGFYPLRPIATGETFFPGSTMKVVTSTAAYNLKPSLAGFNYPQSSGQTFPDSNRTLHSDNAPQTCGGTMTEMLPASCNPGYGELGIQLSLPTLLQQAELFGFNSIPPIDLPSNSQQPVGGLVASTLCTSTPSGVCTKQKTTELTDRSQAFLAYTAIGQDVPQESALQNAMVAAGIANGGVIMTPHLLSSISDSQGAPVESYTPKPMPRSASAQAAQSVAALMESVPISGTAAGVGFPTYLCAAVKTGTAQTGLNKNQDWMIGFAPANDPKIAVAVVVPNQNTSSDGASIAGPIMKKVMQAALPAGSVQQPCNVTPPPLSAYGQQAQPSVTGNIG